MVGETTHGLGLGLLGPVVAWDFLYLRKFMEQYRVLVRGTDSGIPVLGVPILFCCAVDV